MSASASLCPSNITCNEFELNASLIFLVTYRAEFGSSPETLTLLSVSKSTTLSSTKLLVRTTFTESKSINGETSSLLLKRINSVANDFSLLRISVSLTWEAIILGLLNVFNLFNDTSSKPNILKDPSDPLILVPVTVFTLVLIAVPLGVTTVADGRIYS